MIYKPILLLLMFLSAGCTPEPEPIYFGRDLCTYCKMMISDSRFGGELVTNKGKVYKYDSVECLAASYINYTKENEDVHSLWVVDFNITEQLINAEQAIYLRNKDLRSPMGLDITAFTDSLTAGKRQVSSTGTLLSWKEVQEVVNKQWFY